MKKTTATTSYSSHAHLFAWSPKAKSSTGAYHVLDNILNKHVTFLVTKIEKTRNFYVSLSDKGTARFSKQAAMECARFVQLARKRDAYRSRVQELSKSWVDYKKSHGLYPQIGVASGSVANSIQAFRSNVRTQYGQTKKGWVVGVNPQLDDDSTLKQVFKPATDGLFKKNRVKKLADYLHPKTIGARLYSIEHGKKMGKRRTGTVPARPVYSYAIQQFIKLNFTKDFIGKVVVEGNRLIWRN